MDYILDIIKKISIFYIAAYFLLNLVNDEKYRHYIKMFIGIAMIIMTMKPAAALLNLDERFENFYTYGKSEIMSDEMTEKIKAADESRKSVVLHEYYKIIEDDIADKLSEYDTYLKNFDMSIEADEDDENFGNINYISFIIIGGREEKVNVPDIVIGENEVKTNPVVIEIKKYISDVYKINPGNIYVNISL